MHHIPSFDLWVKSSRRILRQGARKRGRCRLFEGSESFSTRCSVSSQPPGVASHLTVKADACDPSGIIQRNDPDVIVGHELLGTNLEVILQRMKDLKADHWSRIGRFRRTQLKIGRMWYSNTKYLGGRLVADLSSDGAKVMIDSVTWSMTEMFQQQLGITREDIDPDDTAGYFDGYAVSADRLLHFIRHLQMDAFGQMAINAKVQLLPLTRQLTTLAGNSW